MDRRQALATALAVALSGGTVSVALAAMSGTGLLGLGGSPQTDNVAPAASTLPPTDPEVVTSIVYIDDVVPLPVAPTTVASAPAAPLPAVPRERRSTSATAPRPTAPTVAPTAARTPVPTPAPVTAPPTTGQPTPAAAPAPAPTASPAAAAEPRPPSTDESAVSNPAKHDDEGDD